MTGAWANEYLYFEVSGTSATMKYGEIILGKPYYDERADWWISNNSPWDGRENIKTITVDASCQNFNQENLSELFYEFTNLKTITNIDKLNTANVLDMSRLFQGCSSLSTLDLSGWNTSEVTDMSSMFYGCTSLTTLNIIGWDTSKVTNTVSMFSGCTKLASISFPASLTTIGDDAFQGCTDLATVTVYAPSCTLGSNAFNGCGKLSNIYVFSDRVNYYQNATNWKDYAEIITGIIGGYCGTTDHEKDVVWVLTGESTNYTLTITGTGAMADYPDPSERPWDSYATEIETVIIEDGVTSIGAYAFQSCTSLSSITLAEGLTTIGGYAFYNCGTTIESVTIPESVTSIGGNAFNGTNVTNFYINNIPSKIAIGETPFKADGVTIHVFTQMQSTFENATNWSAYTGHFNADIAISHVQSITLDNESMIMKTNTSGKLNATINPADARVKDVVFTSSNDNIIHITNAATGEFEAGSTEGNATITCTAMDGSGQYSSCTVTVWKSFTPAESVTLNMSSMSVNVGNTFRLTATINPFNATYKDVTWRSSDENVATVDNNGYVTAIVPGVATITAISHDGQARANCVVTVDASGSCGTGVTWTLTGTSPNYTLTISGTGAMADYPDPSEQPWYSYATEIETVIIEDDVTSIGDYAFGGCSGLTEVTFATGSKLETIGEAAFSDCFNLTTVTIPASVTTIGDYAFVRCGSLTTVTIPASVTTIGDYAFLGCESLTTVTIPASVTSIGYGVFGYCSNIATMTVEAGNTVYDSRNVCNAIIEKESNTLIFGCKNTIIPDDVTSIGNNAFESCTGLTTITIPASVTSIGNGVFAGCSNLATMTVEAGNTVYDSRNVCNAIIEKSTNTLIAGCKGTTIPTTVTSIGNAAFSSCSGLTSITIPASVKSIGDFAFDGCENLTSITIPASVTSIGNAAFQCCNGLTSITIPATVTSIGDYAFGECVNLATVTVFAPSCSLGEGAFNSCDNLTNIYVFSDLVDDYQAAWSTYAGIITAIPTVTTSYVDASGTLHENVEAVPLNNAMTTLPTGTYVVNNDVTYTSTVTLSGDVTLILADGKTMSVTTTDNHECINADGHSLHIYGQTQGTGTLSAQIQGNADYVIYIKDGTLGIHGGNVYATVGSTKTSTAIYLIRHNAGDAFIIDRGTVTANGNTGYGIQGLGGNYCINGGQVIATGASKGIFVSTPISSYLGVLILSGGTITASSFYTASEAAGGKYAGSIKVADGHIYYDEDGNSYTAGTLTSEQITAIAGKTLRPVTGVTLTKEGDNVSATFDGTSTTTVSIPVDVNVTSVTYERTFTDGRPSTVMLPFSKAVDDIGGGTFYTFGGVKKENNKWVAKMNEVTGSLTKNTPYLFVPTGTSLTFTGGATLNTTDGGGKETADQGSHWTFKGTYEYKEWISGGANAEEIGKAYGFAGVAKDGINVGDFVKVASGAKIRPMGCYLLWSDTPNASRAAARGAATEELPQSITVRLVSADGEVTGIGEIDTKTGEMTFDSEAWYTLNGVRLSGKPTKKGLYINNGKKVVIK